MPGRQPKERQNSMDKNNTTMKRKFYILFALAAALTAALPGKAQQKKEAYVVQLPGKTELKFVYDGNKSKTEQVAKKLRLKVWDIDETQTLSTGLKIPAWAGSLDSSNKWAKKVVFDKSFKDYKPKSTLYWFNMCESLEEVDGMENLNTFSVTDMRYMFKGCSSLKTLDLYGFKTLNVARFAGMFNGCSSLTTIYCEDTWTAGLGKSNGMFDGCAKLKGAVAYDSKKTDVEMANPETGYFTKKVEEYDIWVAGVKVTNLNAGNVTGTWLKGGKVSYDKAANTLTLDNAVVDYDGDSGMELACTDLVVRLVGDSKISYKGNIIIQKTTTFTGGGSLTAISTDGYGAINPRDAAKLTIDGCTVVAKGGKGIICTEESTLAVKNGAMVSATGTDFSIGGNTAVELDGVEILSPTEELLWGGFILDKKLFTKVLLYGKTVKPVTTEVVIGPAGGLYGVMLDSYNDKKIAVIKAVRESTSMGLKEAKELVEKAPVVVIESLSIAAAIAARDRLIEAGGTAHIYLHGTWKPSGISSPTAGVQRRGVYNLHGVSIGTSADRLPAGVYIIDGKKIVKK